MSTMDMEEDYMWTGILHTEKHDYVLTLTSAQIVNGGNITVYSQNFNFGSYTNEKGEKQTCVDIYVMHKPMTKKLPNINYKIAKLISTHYHEKCSVDEKLKRGDGTQHMLLTAMTFVCKMCPFITGFEINDLSTRMCDNNTMINLSYFSITNYGQTWYERHFKAYIPDATSMRHRPLLHTTNNTNKPNNNTAKNTSHKKKEITKMDQYKDTIHKLMIQPLPEWNIFKVIFLKSTPREIQQDLETLYRASSTYGELFKNIHELGISKACIYFESWINTVMTSTNLQNYIMFTQWIIPTKELKQITIHRATKDFAGKFADYPKKM